MFIMLFSIVKFRVRIIRMEYSNGNCLSSWFSQVLGWPRFQTVNIQIQLSQFTTRPSSRMISILIDKYSSVTVTILDSAKFSDDIDSIGQIFEWNCHSSRMTSTPNDKYTNVSVTILDSTKFSEWPWFQRANIRMQLS